QARESTSHPCGRGYAICLLSGFGGVLSGVRGVKGTLSLAVGTGAGSLGGVRRIPDGRFGLLRVVRYITGAGVRVLWGRFEWARGVALGLGQFTALPKEVGVGVRVLW